MIMMLMRHPLTDTCMNLYPSHTASLNRVAPNERHPKMSSHQTTLHERDKSYSATYIIDLHPTAWK